MIQSKIHHSTKNHFYLTLFCIIKNYSCFDPRLKFKISIIFVVELQGIFGAKCFKIFSSLYFLAVFFWFIFACFFCLFAFTLFVFFPFSSQFPSYAFLVYAFCPSRLSRQGRFLMTCDGRSVFLFFLLSFSSSLCSVLLELDSLIIYISSLK